MINGTTFLMIFGSRNLIKFLFWWSEVNFCHKGHLKVIWGHFYKNSLPLDFHAHFLIFVFYDPLGSIKHKNFGTQFFQPLSVFFPPLESRKPPKIGKKSGSTKMINGTTLYMFLGSRNLIKLLFWWSEVNFCHKGHLKVIWGHFYKNSLPLDFHGRFLIFVFITL